MKILNKYPQGDLEILIKSIEIPLKNAKRENIYLSLLNHVYAKNGAA